MSNIDMDAGSVFITNPMNEYFVWEFQTNRERTMIVKEFGQESKLTINERKEVTIPGGWVPTHVKSEYAEEVVEHLAKAILVSEGKEFPYAIRNPENGDWIDNILTRKMKECLGKKEAPDLKWKNKQQLLEIAKELGVIADESMTNVVIQNLIRNA